MAPTEKLLSDLAGTANKMNVKQSIVTPTVAKLIEPKELPGLETLIVGGEQLTPDAVEKWAPSRTLLNVYGPTETSMVFSTKKVLPGDDPQNIGQPHPTTPIFIMNQEGTDLVPTVPSVSCVFLDLNSAKVTSTMIQRQMLASRTMNV